MDSYDTEDMPNILADNGVQQTIGNVTKPLGGIMKMPNFLQKPLPLQGFNSDSGEEQWPL